jgi:hypothetical protein
MSVTHHHHHLQTTHIHPLMSDKEEDEEEELDFEETTALQVGDVEGMYFVFD